MIGPTGIGLRNQAGTGDWDKSILV